MFTHVVLFWLKPDSPAPALAQLQADCIELLGQVPGVKFISTGRPAMTPREVVDNSYDIGLCVVFDSTREYQVYETHPLHLQFIERNKAAWDRVRVVDFR